MKVRLHWCFRVGFQFRFPPRNRLTIAQIWILIDQVLESRHYPSNLNFVIAQSLKYWSVTDIVRPIREIVRRIGRKPPNILSDPSEIELVQHKCIGVQLNCNFVQRKCTQLTLV